VMLGGFVNEEKTGNSEGSRPVFCA
jgi:hypothetical protein